jgi:uncharacterized alkaline shock family protein YloU
MEGRARISPEVLASYAADAAAEVPGVRRLADSRLPGRKGVRVTTEGDRVALELYLSVEWGASLPAVGRGVQARVREYLERMVDLEPVAVDVVVARIAAPR